MKWKEANFQLLQTTIARLSESDSKALREEQLTIQQLMMTCIRKHFDAFFDIMNATCVRVVSLPPKNGLPGRSATYLTSSS